MRAAFYFPGTPGLLACGYRDLRAKADVGNRYLRAKADVLEVVTSLS